MTCPKCGQEMRHKSESMEHAARAAKHGVTHGVQHVMRGDPFMLLAFGGYWLCSKLGNLMAPTWACRKCGHAES